MSDKVVFVFDKPKNCSECPLFYVDHEGYMAYYACCNNDYEFDWFRGNEGKEPKICPLRPLPQKLEVKADTIDDIMHTEFQMTDVIADKFIANIRFETDKLVALGWNACLKEITGEEE